MSRTRLREPAAVKTLLILAAFLYMGGYMILAKTPKAGVYEPRHWFALTDETIEIVDVQEEKCKFQIVFSIRILLVTNNVWFYQHYYLVRSTSSFILPVIV